ncbi:MAG TPA: F0F1 ATP synthase subunit A [Blastocatellia bacterium]|nr:F0F1 ATP synthase subunit A [Blastocatellia bacterium]
MLLALFAFLQEHAPKAAEHAAEGAKKAGEHGGGHHTPWIVEQVNHILGPAVFSIQHVIMPPIYSLFGAHWPGEGMTAEQYMASGQLPIPTQAVMFSIVIIFTVVILTILRGKLSTDSPTTKQQTFEVGVEALRDMLKDLIGPKGMKHFPVIATFALLILISNLMGFIPGLISATANLNVTLALAITSFLYYNYIGIKENGLIGYLKHFMGPVALLAPLMFLIELVSHFARILSLSLRLFGNIYGEEQVSGVISGLVPWGVPILLMPLALLASFLQTFIFVVLSMLYIAEMTHHEDDHGHGEAAHAH